MIGADWPTRRANTLHQVTFALPDNGASSANSEADRTCKYSGNKKQLTGNWWQEQVSDSSENMCHLGGDRLAGAVIRPGAALAGPEIEMDEIDPRVKAACSDTRGHLSSSFNKNLI